MKSNSTTGNFYINDYINVKKGSSKVLKLIPKQDLKFKKEKIKNDLIVPIQTISKIEFQKQEFLVNLY